MADLHAPLDFRQSRLGMSTQAYDIVAADQACRNSPTTRRGLISIVAAMEMWLQRWKLGSGVCSSDASNPARL
mgnify:CR=1 FL=1